MENGNNFGKIDSKRENNINFGERIIVFIGAEGSGKSILGKRLALESGKPYVSIGDLIRNIATEETQIGQEARDLLSEHRYIKPEFLSQILNARFKKGDLKKGFILDGGLRSDEQVSDFDKILKDFKMDDISLTVIHLRIPGWMSFDRLLLSQSARNRNDDTFDGILNRLSSYYSDLAKRASHIRQHTQWELISVQATKSVDDCYKEILGILQDRSNSSLPIA